MPYVHEVTIDEATLLSKEDLHEVLAQALGFPSFYGANLNALDDCLGDISDPSLVRVIRRHGAPEDLPLAGYLDTACLCLMRVARENPALDVEISFSPHAVPWYVAYAQPSDEDLGLD